MKLYIDGRHANDDDQLIDVSSLLGHSSIRTWFDSNGIGFGETKYFDRIGNFIKSEIKPTGIRIIME